MTSFDPVVQSLLQDQVPLRIDAQSDWSDVLRRAGARRAVVSRRRRTLLAAALAAALVATLTPLGGALAALGRDAIDGFSSWVGGSPGTPAPQRERNGFVARNVASYASFPPGTKLRLLRREVVAGTTFSLLGFRDSSSLCLRLVRADRPAARGVNQCVTARELTGSGPAVVASEASFGGRDRRTVNGVLGFANDSVRAIETRRASGRTARALVRSNAFLSLDAAPSGTIRNPVPLDRIVQVWALTKTHRRVLVPFVASDLATYADGVPHVPSFLKLPYAKAAELPGPARVGRRFAGGGIGWLEHHEARGRPLTADARLLAPIGPVAYARSVQPDPGNPLRVGLLLVRADEGSRFSQARPGQLVLCAATLEPLATGSPPIQCDGPTGEGLFGAGRPLLVTGSPPGQVTRFAGVAADGVARIDLYLSSGRVVPATLRDNAFVVEAPTAQLPGKLVAFDRGGAPIGIEVFQGVAKPAPCPGSTFPPLTAPLPPPRPYERVDLGAGTIDGRRLFGLRRDELEAVLGKPDKVGWYSSEPTLFYGGAGYETAALVVGFGLHDRVDSLQLQGDRVVDRRLGHVLRAAPLDLQRKLTALRPTSYHLRIPWGAVPSRGCVGVFEANDERSELDFGISPYRPRHPWLLLATHEAIAKDS